MLTACETAPTPSPSPSASPVVTADGPGVLRWALSADPTSLDPARIVRDEDALLVDALFDSLTRLGPDLEPVPALATGWQRNDDATSFTFTLDPDAVWHDGTAVTAEDVVRGLRRIADGGRAPASLHADLLRDVAGYAAAQVGQPLPGVTAVDEETVRIDLVRPVPELPTVLAHPALAPVPPEALESPLAFAESPVGNGPFRLAEPWVPNQFLRLAPSDTHPAPGNVEEVVFRIYASDTDRATQHADLLAGQIQVSHVPSGLREDVAEDPSLRLHDGITGTTSVLFLDTRQAPLDDVRFRRAVSLLVDRTSLAARTAGAREAATSLVPPSLPGAAGSVCVWCRYDPDAAGRLIEQVVADRVAAGAVERPSLVLQTSDDAIHTAMATQLSAELRRLGVRVQQVVGGTTDYLELAEEEQPAVIRLGWTAEEATLRPWTEQLLAAGTVGARLTGWQPASLADLLGAAAASDDAATRQRTWQEVERLALDAAVVAPVLHYRDDLLVSIEVDGLVRDPYGNVDLAAVRLPAS